MSNTRYKAYVGYEFEIENSIKDLVKISKPITAFETDTICEYHDSKPYTKLGLWRLEKDASIINGAEFISPPMLMEDSFEMMRKFFQAVTESQSTTSSRCGCHTNICLMYGGKILKIDDNALLYNLDWRLLCSLWPDRLKKNNKYCRRLSNILTELKQSLTDRKYNVKDIGKTLFMHYHGFIMKKNSSWDKKGVYYELRFPGGRGYHLYPEKIEATVRHFKEALIKSRLAACKTNDKFKNKKIISYVNRVNQYQPVEIPYIAFNSLTTKHARLKEINKLKNIKNIIPTQNTELLNKKLLHLVRFLINNFTYDNTYLTNPVYSKLIETVNKENVIYYITKYFVVSNTSFLLAHIASFNRLLSLKKTVLTIPITEFDTDKLWIIKLIPLLKTSSKNLLTNKINNNCNSPSIDNIINITRDSIKNIKTKNILDKILTTHNEGGSLKRYIKMITKHSFLSSGGNQSAISKKDNNF